MGRENKTDKENNVYKDSNIEIKENILKFSNHVIQLSNVSSVSISPMEKEKFQVNYILEQ